MKEISDLDKQELDKMVAFAHKLGWNGVENSKILSIFYKNYIKDLQKEIKILKYHAMRNGN